MNASLNIKAANGRSSSLKIAVIDGGLTHERDISLRSGRRVATLLRAKGHKVKILEFNSTLLEELEEFQPDLAWPLVHGSVGEDGSLQDLLDLLKIPYVGSTSAGCRQANQKPIAKTLVSKAGLPTPRFLSLPQTFFRQVGVSSVIVKIASEMGFPLIVKPSVGGSALGVSKVRNLEELRASLVEAFAYNDTIMIEEFIVGREIAVSVLDINNDLKTLGSTEIVVDQGDYDFEARYIAGLTTFFTPPENLSKAEIQTLNSYADQVHRILGLRHLSRIDLIFDGKNIWFIDANIIPGMTDTSLYPQAAEYESNFAEILHKIAIFAVN